MRILGVDPGSNVTGFGVVERCEGGSRSVTHVAHGTLRAPTGASLATRLDFFHRRIQDVVREHEPELAVVERVFIAANPASALVLGQARGVALAAIASFGIEVSELSAREVKQAVTGSGAAGKAQVKAMVARLLKLESEPPSDAADALAIALCHAQGGRLRALGSQTRRTGRRNRRALTALVLERER